MSFAEQLTRLQAFLDADELHDEALDYVATHGYLTALSICAEEVPEREWIDAIFSETPNYKDDAQREEIEGSLVKLKDHIARQLASDEEFELPCDLDLGDEPDESDLFALGVVFVVWGFRENGVDPFTLRYFFSADGQGSQVAVSGYVVQRLVMQLVSVEEGLQAG
jgi:uncharacterized protein